MGGRLIALDIDGTLLDCRSRLPDVNRQAVVDATARGIEIVLVTGRHYDFAMPVARQIPCPLTVVGPIMHPSGSLVSGDLILHAWCLNPVDLDPVCFS